MLGYRKLNGRSYSWNEYLELPKKTRRNVLKHLELSGIQWVYDGCTDDATYGKDARLFEWDKGIGVIYGRKSAFGDKFIFEFSIAEVKDIELSTDPKKRFGAVGVKIHPRTDKPIIRDYERQN